MATTLALTLPQDNHRGMSTPSQDKLYKEAIPPPANNEEAGESSEIEEETATGTTPCCSSTAATCAAEGVPAVAVVRAFGANENPSVDRHEYNNSDIDGCLDELFAQEDDSDDDTTPLATETDVASSWSSSSSDENNGSNDDDNDEATTSTTTTMTAVPSSSLPATSSTCDDDDDNNTAAAATSDSSSSSLLQRLPYSSSPTAATATAIAASSPLFPGGLENLGNTCYMNSALQMIASLENFLEDLQRQEPPSPTSPAAVVGDHEDGSDNHHHHDEALKLRDAFLDVIRRLNQGEIVRPTDFKEQMDDRTSLFLGFRQQDSHEFLTTLLDLLDEDYKRMKQDDHGDQDEACCGDEHAMDVANDNEGEVQSQTSSLDLHKSVSKKARIEPPVPMDAVDATMDESSSYATAHSSSAKSAEGTVMDESSCRSTKSYSELDVDAIGRLIHGDMTTDDAFILPEVSTTCIGSQPHHYKLVGGRMNTSDVVLTPYSSSAASAPDHENVVSAAGTPQAPSASQPTTQHQQPAAGATSVSQSDGDDETLASSTTSLSSSSTGCGNNQRPSPVDSHFTTSVRVRLTCDSCKYTRSHKETFYHLSLEIGSDCCNVEDGLRKFFASCTQEIKCEKCFCETATQSMEITKLPPVLLLHFKRFIVDISPDYSSITYRKNQSCIMFDENLTLEDDIGVLSDFMAVDCSVPAGDQYVLKSVVNHIGSSASCGHYTADAKRGDNDWIRFNDSYVSKANSPTEESRQTAYMVAYELL